ncbi:YheT family hydrolase [Marinoscillum sp. MHG1-6]|uniref:YheT family hydrolase n=1 Tax=Marinoscillum sp. MHG1-6 TaxID=2959627 RepID=UPI002158701C|nr:alpha/beta fold hydrolase [Marinoscillum sp. MHG1-6]
MLKYSYKRPFWLPNGHLETIYPALFRKVNGLTKPVRQRISTPDDDFLDLDWYKNGNDRLMILQHGLEGSSDRSYVLGMAKIFFQNGYDVCAWNFRGCSSEMNSKPILYHSGATYDLDTVVSEGLKSYEDITLVGFSLGGNLTLKYLGERDLDPRIKRAAVISVPVDLGSSSDVISAPQNFIYEQRFLTNLKQKVRRKERKIPGSMPMGDLKKVKTLRDFDEYFTAPIHGFKGATDYYNQNSSIHFLKDIKIPTLILNAKNDPLVSEKSSDESLASLNQNITLLTPDQGGHVGFSQGLSGPYWSEEIAVKFCSER